MPVFNLTDDDIQKLQRRFNLFQKERKILHNLLNNYVADYRQYSGRASEKYEYLREKYISKSPSLSHLIFNDGKILWSFNDISIVLGRHLTSIIRTFEKIEKSEGYCSRLIALRETVKAKNGHNIQVYHEEIFDLIIDFYEYEYLLRFSEPRRGVKENAPDINEIKRFWNYLKDFDNYNNHILQQKYQINLPDIPKMSLKDILSLIWEKVFNIKIGTVCSVIFAVCFEIVRRFLGINLWFAIIPALIFILCAVLIHQQKFKPDILSDIASGALLFTLLWISASLSVDRFQEETKEPKIYLSPSNYNEKLYFTIKSNVVPQEYFYRISPDVEFSSTGFLPQINPNNGKNYPDLIIKNNKTDGIINLELKYLDDNDKESKIWKFSFDFEAEKLKLNKKFILNSNEAWVTVRQNFYYDENGEKYYSGNTIVEINMILMSYEGKNSVESIVYGINKDFPDKKLQRKYLTDYEIFTTKENDIDFVSSYLIFKDGSSSDIRINKK